MAGRATRVKLYMRIEGEPEVPVGSAARVTDVPELLRDLADRWAAVCDDELDLLAGRACPCRHDNGARGTSPDPGS